MLNTLRQISFIALGLSLSLLAQAESVPQATIAIVIDDLGHHLERGKTLTDLPYPLTLAFLPHRQYTKTLAIRGYSQGKEIMLHAPMENTRKFSLGRGGLTANMDKTLTQTTLNSSLESIPYIKGMNNHTGSALTTNKQSMLWVMESLAQHPYYFLDSKTSADSVAAKTAIEFGIPTLVRDVFLDHEQTPQYVASQFEKLIKIAKRKGAAIAIGHPYPVTITHLKSALPRLGEQGISIATVSGLWQIQHPNKAMFPSEKPTKNTQLAFSGDF
ncbi:hypothetical protein A3715_00275 [Oleiphilus sp. HI0009]|uniref:divergent polysaccharide deacetylase family protein n=2 Tax=Oleiphilus TaxID=141450 RepID=UPI0007C29597|nr:MULTISPECIES: divergent polysaccharide deacetylase family protein [unclassified Oleiphilus]KZX82230.1 hypothetical protein A3715_00275 [Oleiphilus sp. HI0009]KZY61758.1 hypothetical protein A3738_02880 [Oleiphilus sp. HI0066]KZY70744.1 hypothetical protein A3739_06185 [Oleiphilus sp. HI0067]